MAFTQYVEIKDGFELIKSEKVVSPEEARSILWTRRKRNITYAIHEGDYIVLTRHSFRCPYCRKHSPAYFRTVGKPVPVHKQEINLWITGQYSFFEHKPRLIMNNVNVSAQKLYCKYCHQTSMPYSHKRKIIIEVERKKIKISLVSKNITEFLPPSKIGTVNEYAMSFPVTEMLTFNLGNGHIYYYIKENERLTFARDLRSEKEFRMDSILCMVINKYDIVRRKVAGAFQCIYGFPLPFSNKELSLETLLKMTRFVGYSSDFYKNSVPYDLKTGMIDRSFKTITKKIHFANKLPEIYERSELPQVKSVKRLFFKQPGYFFYIQEAEAAWSLLKNIDSFRRLLQLNHAFDILSYLHDYPVTISFFQSFMEQQNASRLLFQFENNWRFLQDYALHFSCLNHQRQLAEMEAWQKRWKPDNRRGKSYSIPIGIVAPSVWECEIDGFEFIWLKTRADYVHAGNELNNCLADWDVTDNSVMVMKKNGCCKAAIEIQNGHIQQAYAEHNYLIEDDMEVLNAYNHWRRIFKIPKFGDN